MRRSLLAAAAAVLLTLPVSVVSAPAAGAATSPSGSAISSAPSALASTSRLTLELRASRAASPHRYTTVAYAKWYAAKKVAARKWGPRQMRCLVPLWAKESEWRYKADSGKYLGIPQTTASQIRGYGYTVAQYRANPEVQVLVGLRYIVKTYGSPCSAWAFWRSHHWY